MARDGLKPLTPETRLFRLEFPSAAIRIGSMAKTEKHMKTFLAVYMGTSATMKKWEKPTENTRHEREMAGMQGWMAWGKKNSRSIVYEGGPLGATQRADKRGIGNESS